MHPVGPRSPGVYWFRRMMVAVLALVVVAGVVWFVVRKAAGPGVDTAADTSPTSSSQVMTGVLATSGRLTDTSDATKPTGSPPVGSGTTSAGTSASKPTTSQASKSTGSQAPATKTAAKPPTPTSTPSTAKSTAPATTATTPKTTTSKAASTTHAKPTTSKPATSTSTTPKSSTPPPPSTDAQGRLICSDAVTRVVASTGAPSFPRGSQPILGLTVTNVGSVPCVRDLSGALQVFTVHTAAGQRVWSTADCFPGTGKDVRQLAAGQSVTYNIKWSGTTSQPGCAGQRVPVPAGSYTLTASVGTAVSKPAAFTITG